MKIINPKECQYWNEGGYCCDDLDCENKSCCNLISHCGMRMKCHVKIGSDTKCISFVQIRKKKVKR